MRQAWTQAVFDGFLIEDVERLARRALVDAGYLRGTVAVAIDESTPGDKRLTVSIDPGLPVTSRRLAFEGNASVPSEALQAVVASLGLDVEAWTDSERLADALEASYRSMGYQTAAIAVEPPVFVDAAAILPVRVDEGPLFHVRGVQVAGAAAKAPAVVRELAGVAAGAVYEPAAVEPARRRIEVAYLEDGFADVRVTASVLLDRDEAGADLTFTIAEGRQQVLSAIEIRGARVTSSAIIDRAVDLPVGAPLDREELYRAQKRLYDTGVFRTVDVSVEPTVDSDGRAAYVQPVRAGVVLDELPRYRFRYGLRAIDDARKAEGGRLLRFGFVADLLNRNLLGRAIAAGAAGQLETDRWLARAIVSLPSIGALPVVTNVFLTRSRQEFTPEGETSFVEQATEVTVEQRFRPRAAMAVTYGYTFGQTRVFEPDPPPGSLFPLDVRVKVARLTGTWAWDTRDDPANATAGWFHSSGIEYGPDALGSDLRFVRYLAQQFLFRSIRGRLVLASAFRLGMGRGIGQDLIPSERFYAGGATSVRGFAEQGLGDTDFIGDPVGGGGLFVFNQEGRLLLHRWVSAVGFIDAGNVFDRAGDISLTDLEAGVGTGLRVHAPFATLRLDVGFPLTSRRDQPRARWYFGIGQTF
jgi:outer membrane protein assembly factor BamA